MNASSAPGSGTDFKLGVTVAIVAALTALTDLGGSRLSDDELIAVSERTSAYMWHQAKSIKQASAEGRHLTLKALAEAGALPGADAQKIAGSLASFHEEAARLERDKHAILEGGEIDGLRIEGAQFFQARAQALGRAGDIVDVALLLFHLALLLGGVGIASQDARLERLLFRIIVSAACVGIVFALAGAAVWFAGTPR